MSIAVFLIAFLVMLLVVVGMSVGVMAGRAPLKGSCGGLSAVGIEGRCEICGDDPARCEDPGTNSGPGSGSNRESDAAEADYYNAAAPHSDAVQGEMRTPR